MKFRFQSFVDVATSASSMQVLQWSVGGAEVVNRCRHLFGAYKYFKLGKISVKMIPASTLPVDPQGLSYDLDDPLTVDPRDQMNPGLVRITNGEDIFTNISALTDDQQMAAYNTMMLDPRWSKFMLQSGFRRSAYPLYWQVGQLSQDKWPGTVDNVPIVNSAGGVLLENGIAAEHAVKTGVNDSIHSLRCDAGSNAHGLFQVGHRGRLGFLPTDYYQEIPVPASIGGDTRFMESFGVNNVPQVRVITCILPKAYKTIYYYRVFITEEVIFAGLRSSPIATQAGLNADGHLGFDQFTFGTVTSVNPTGNIGIVKSNADMNNGDQIR